MFVVGWCLLVMYSVKPRVPQPEVGRTYETWSAGPRYLTKGEYFTQVGLMVVGFALAVGGSVAHALLELKDR